MATLNRSMMYSVADTCWFTITWLNPALSLFVLFHSGKVSSNFAKTGEILYPGGYWGLVVLILLLAVIGAVLIIKSKKEINKLVVLFFGTIIPPTVVGFAIFKLYEKTGTL